MARADCYDYIGKFENKSENTYIEITWIRVYISQGSEKYSNDQLSVPLISLDIQCGHL